MDEVIQAAAAVSLPEWPLTIGLGIAIIGGIVGIIRGMQWMDDRFVSRREFERIITDNARQEKLLDQIEKLTAAVLSNNKHR